MIKINEIIILGLLQASGHGYVKCENLSPLLDNEHDTRTRMDEQTKVAGDSSDGKGMEHATDDDIMHDDAEANILEQSQVSGRVLLCKAVC